MKKVLILWTILYLSNRMEKENQKTDAMDKCTAVKILG